MDGLPYPVPSSISHLNLVLCYERSKIRTDAVENINTKRDRIMFMLNDIRHHDIQELEKCTKEYLHVWLVLVTVLENQRTKILSPFTFSSGWMVPSNNSRGSHVMDVWRFETIMSGVLYASILFNMGVMEKNSAAECDGSTAAKRFIDAYSILNNICLTNIIAWKLRDELRLPFECTEKGCRSIMGMCLVEIQRSYIADPRANIEWEDRFRMSYWNYKKMDEISDYLSCRIKDKTISDHFWLKHGREYKRESIVEMYYCYIMHLDETGEKQNSERQKKIQFLCECLLKIIDDILLKRKRILDYIVRRKDVSSDTNRNRLVNMRQVVSSIEIKNKEMLNSNMLNTIGEEKYSEKDPREYIEKDWLSVMFYGIRDEKHAEKYNSYCGLDQTHAQELRNVIFYSM